MSEIDSYDTIPYESMPFADTHPGNLACLARLYGVAATNPARCRVLELGCANGGNLIPMAARLPGSAFVGLELSGNQARDGSARVAALGLDNCVVRQGDILAFADDGTRYDYIIAHGVYSWSPPAVRDRILALAAELLSDNGIAYVSYNSLPGWRMRGMLRDMLLHRVKGIEAPAEQLATARDYLAFLETALGDSEANNAVYLRYEIARIREAHPSYLFHEYLETFNDPVLFRDFVDSAAAHGLDYVCDIDLMMQFPAYLGDAAEALLSQIEDPFERWQQMDFLLNRNFHQSLLCRREARPSREPDPGRMRTFAWLADVKPPRKLDLRRAKAQNFTAANGEKRSVEHPLTKAAMALLAQSYPHPLGYAELLVQAGGLVGGQGGTAFVGQEEHLLDELFSLFAIGFASARPLDMERATADAPMQADAVSRLCAELGDAHIPSRHHGTLGLDPFSARLLAYLDGRTDRAGLIDALLADFRPDGPLVGLVAPDTPHDQLRRQVERNTDRLLALFRRQGVISGSADVA